MSSIGATARAEENDLRYDWRVDGALTAGAFAFWGGTQLLESRLAPAECRWCDPGSVDASVRTALRWNDTSAANLASNLGAYVFVPLASLGLLALDTHGEGRTEELPGDGLVIAEAVALNGALTQLVKFTAGRERPFVHALPADQKPLTGRPADNNVSFYSSHTVSAPIAEAQAQLERGLQQRAEIEAELRAARIASDELDGLLRERDAARYTCGSAPGSGALQPR